MPAFSVSIFVSNAASTSARPLPSCIGQTPFGSLSCPWQPAKILSVSARPLPGRIGQTPFGSLSCPGQPDMLLSVYAGSKFLGHPIKKPVDLWIALVTN